jgi:HAD superfamily hydrolase (TIGR01549 family)
MTVKAVIFDLDGTLTSFNLDYMVIRAEVRGFLIKTGLPASLFSINESIFEMLKKAEIFLKNNSKSDKAVEKIRNGALAIAEKYELEASKTTSPFPGAIDTLESLKKMNLKIGLCTINGEKSTNYILKKFRITSLFDAVIPRNKVKYVKPNTEHLEATLEALKVNPRDAMFIGDGTRDMQCAREAGVKAVGLPTGVSSEKDLMNSGADYLITSISDLPTLIEHINKTAKS